MLFIILTAVLFHSVGYVVGLGDRHVQNILIDKQTAEFIHIDLGLYTVAIPGTFVWNSFSHIFIVGLTQQN